MRERAGWRQTKAMAEIFIKVMTGEDKNIPLPWDEDTEDEETTEEDLEELRKKAERMEDYLNGKKYSLES